jgi:phosphoglycolate phosphatase
VGKEFCTLEELVTLYERALIFDLDGTLVDSTRQIGYSINCARNEFGYSELPRSAIEELLGLPINHFLMDIRLSKTEKEKVILRFREILKLEIMKQNLVFPGVEDYLIKARGLNVKLAIATSKPTYLAKMVIWNSSLNQLFDVIQGTEDFPAKPDPTCINKAMNSLKTKNAIMVGDRVEDVIAANAAGIDCVGIAQSFHGKQVLKEAGARYAFDSFFEFANSEESIQILIH